MSKFKKKSPKDTRWIMSRRDLPQTRVPSSYLLKKETGDERTITLSHRYLQVFEALRIGPIHCASPLRLSDAVLILRRDYEVDIVTDFHTEGVGETQAARP